jgi:hypothetical protein
MTTPEVTLLKEIAGLRQVLAVVADEKKKAEIRKQIQEKQIEFNIMMERQHRQKRSR